MSRRAPDRERTAEQMRALGRWMAEVDGAEPWHYRCESVVRLYTGRAGGVAVPEHVAIVREAFDAHRVVRS